jgi:GNAT superfamily N-acetyltransferase
MIRTIEELSLNAWPALQTVLLDGWVHRFAGGYTRRANSVNPLYPAADDLETKIARSERLYRDRGLPVVFKLTGASCPAGLDAALAAHGYALDAQTSVQTLPLASFTPDCAPAGAPAVEIAPAVTEAWFDAFGRASNLAAPRRPIAWQMLNTIAPATAFAAITEAGAIVACGFAVAQADYVGFYDIVTDPRYRRRGLAGRLMRSLLAWGQAQGAATAYLQVMLNNPPALALYAGLGFQEAYQYWYRVKA